jgi:uncharacterized membrane protein YfcA
MELTLATILVAFAGVFLICFMKGAFGGGFSIIAIPLLSTVMDPVTAGGLLAPLFIAMDLFALRYWKPSHGRNRISRCCCRGSWSGSGAAICCSAFWITSSTIELFSPGLALAASGRRKPRFRPRNQIDRPSYSRAMDRGVDRAKLSLRALAIREEAIP